MRKKDKIKVVFFLQRAEAWVNFSSVYDCFLENRDIFDVLVLQIPYDSSNLSLSKSKDAETLDFLKSNSIHHVQWGADVNFDLENFNVAFFCHPYENQRPLDFSFERVSALVDYTIYIPYGLSVGAGSKNLFFQYGQPAQKKSSVVVARSELEKKSYEKFCSSGGKNVFVIGHPRFDYYSNLKYCIPDWWRDFVFNRRVVLWNSHFSFTKEFSQKLNFSTFDLFGPEIFEFFIKNRDKVLLIWRPHPLLWSTLIKNELLTLDELNDLKLELKSIGIFLDENIEHIYSFLTSSILLTDAGSFLIEYLATKKPFFFLRNKEGESLNWEANQLVNKENSINSIEDLRTKLNSIICDDLPKVDEKITEKHLPFLDGKCGYRLVKLISGFYGHNFVKEVKKRPRIINFFEEKKENFFLDADNHPVLDKLISNLIKIRNDKKNEKYLTKKIRRLRNFMDSEVKIWVKNHPKIVGVIKYFLGK